MPTQDGNHWHTAIRIMFFSARLHSIEQQRQAWVNPCLWKQTATENIMLLFFAFLLNQAVHEAQPFTHRDYLINKFVWHPVPSRCLVWAWLVVTGCSPPPRVTAQAAFCALGWRPHWWLSWTEARASRPSASYRTGSCTRCRVNTAASKYIRRAYQSSKETTTDCHWRQETLSGSLLI